MVGQQHEAPLAELDTISKGIVSILLQAREKQS
jgi:hypothetical protein